MLMASLFGELPNFPFTNRLFAASKFGKGDFEVEVSQQFLSLLWLHPANFFGGDVGNAGHQERPMHQFIDTLRTPRRQQAPVSGEQGISR